MRYAMLRKSWLVLDALLNLEQYSCLPVIQPADLVEFENNSTERFLISGFDNIDKCLGKFGLSSRGEGHILSAIFLEIPFSGDRILVDRSCVVERKHKSIKTYAIGQGAHCRLQPILLNAVLGKCRRERAGRHSLVQNDSVLVLFEFRMQICRVLVTRIRRSMRRIQH